MLTNIWVSLKKIIIVKSKYTFFGGINNEVLEELIQYYFLRPFYNSIILCFVINELTIQLMIFENYSFIIVCD